MDILIQKRKWDVYEHKVRFFKSRPNLLVRFGIYRLDNDAIDFTWRILGELKQAHITFDELNGEPILPFFLKYANNH